MTELDEEYENIRVESESDDEPLVEFEISVSPADPTLEVLAKRISDEDIIVPFYQRRYVWDKKRASKLIESFLMGVPVPQVFLYVNEDNQLEIIDGQQRLLTIKYFFEGFFGEENKKGSREIFRLTGLAEASRYNKLTFEELPEKYKRKLKNSTLRTVNIKQITPNDNQNSVFYIFERLNTGGDRLRPQEIRNAVYRGPIVSELQKLNLHPAWRTLMGSDQPDKRQKDVELILRLFSLFQNWPDYEKPMLKYLNDQMKYNKEFHSDRAKVFSQRFGGICDLITATIDRPFRPNGPINTAVLEAVMVSLLENFDRSYEFSLELYEQLLTRDDFRSVMSGNTTDTKVVRDRISIASSTLFHAPS